MPRRAASVFTAAARALGRRKPMIWVSLWDGRFFVLGFSSAMLLLVDRSTSKSTPKARKVSKYWGWFRIAALVLLLTGPAIADDVVVTDGDSLRMSGGRVRLWGIDAPELGQRCEWNGQPFDCGRAAKDQLGKLVTGGPVECIPVDRDRYGRTVARCSLGGLDLAAEMVRSGWALDYWTYSHGAYSREEHEAREAGRGLWGGSFQPPWEWRH